MTYGRYFFLIPEKSTEQPIELLSKIPTTGEEWIHVCVCMCVCVYIYIYIYIYMNSKS